MNARLLVLALLGACAAHSEPATPAIDPHVAAGQVVDAVLRSAQPDAPLAVDDWRAAHAQFERDLEGPLRARYGDRTVAEVEYRFGLVRSQLGTGRATETARRLGEQVAGLCADLPVAPVVAQES